MEDTGRQLRTAWPARALARRWRYAVEQAQVGLLRAMARMRLSHLAPGLATVVTVSWNSRSYVEVLVDAVERFAGGVRMLVVDNHFSDGPGEYLRARRDTKAVPLPWNMGHPTALDIGFLLIDTEYAVSLDVDAFPIRGDRLELPWARCKPATRSRTPV